MSKGRTHQGHTARKRFGQNFLTDDSIIHRIIHAMSPRETDNIVEIGPGLGALTRPLLDYVDELDVVEIDRDLSARLPALARHGKTLRIHNLDALTMSLTDMTADETRVRIIGNLPYNISTPLIFHLLSQLELIQDMYFMLQKEVVCRMTAAPGSRDYGRLSVMLQYACTAEYLFTVPPSSFQPAPKVDSAIVRITPKDSIAHPVNDMNLFATVVKTAFSQRRKVIGNSLKKLASHEALTAAGIDPKARAEQIDVEAYVNLCNNMIK